jgi:hypothetical protein
MRLPVPRPRPTLCGRESEADVSDGRPRYYFDPVVFAFLAIRFCTRVFRAADFIIVRRAAAWTSFEAAMAWRDSAVADTFV